MKESWDDPTASLYLGAQNMYTKHEFHVFWYLPYGNPNLKPFAVYADCLCVWSFSLPPSLACPLSTQGEQRAAYLLFAIATPAHPPPLREEKRTSASYLLVL